MLFPELAKAVREQFNIPQRKQMLIELLGSQFKRSYLTDVPDEPHIIVLIFRIFFSNFQIKFLIKAPA